MSGNESINQSPVQEEDHFNTRNWFRFIEPASILTLMIGAIYYIGSSYFDSYFNRLGINHLSVELPTAVYLKHGYLATLLLWGVGAALYASHSQYKNKSGKQFKWLVIFAFNLILPTVFLAVAYDSFVRYFGFSVFLIFTLLVLIAVIFLTYQKKPITGIFNAHPIMRTFVLILLAFAFLTFTAFTFGRIAGTRTIEGNHNLEPAFIKFQWKETPLTELEGKRLILILHNDDKYFVVEHQNPAPENPRVYIVPDDVVKLAEISTIP
ncbi:MAG TPA: hypothetical protein VNB22_04165 [Pyrinomonadaceae bacterium]|jgi:hypothetical protein|nr:hypothetical protein [Pyrinomonadaceae bacterium]